MDASLDSLRYLHINEEKEEEEEEEEEGTHYDSGSATTLQLRSVTSKARWDDETGMAQVLVHKGTFSKSTGVIRRGNLYYSLHETLYLVEIGALVVVSDETDTCLSLADLYIKMSSGKYRCGWDEFRAYRQLKSLGYVVGFRGVAWSLKSGVECVEEEEEEVGIGGARAVFDVHLPNSKFRKSCPGDPSFVVCFTRGGGVPSRGEVEGIEEQCRGVSIKFCSVEQGPVSFFSFDKLELPVLD